MPIETLRSRTKQIIIIINCIIIVVLSLLLLLLLYSANRGDHVMRGWPHKALRKMIKYLKTTCPNHKIEIFSDLDTKLMQCRECQIKLFHR
jgi:uncharacterized membrane protein YeiB